METLTTQSLLETAQSLIGKTIIADGWQRDNGGMISGKITEIQKGRFGDLEYIIHVEPTTELSMDEMTFKKQHLEILLADGKLPEANRLLNSGTNAKIIG
jgi:hypothetical protein